MNLLRSILKLRVVKEFLTYGVHQSMSVVDFKKGILLDKDGMPTSKHNEIVFGKLNENNDVIAIFNVNFFNLSLEKEQFIDSNLAEEVETMVEILSIYSDEEFDPLPGWSDEKLDEAIGTEEGLVEIQETIGAAFEEAIKPYLKHKDKFRLKIVTDKTGVYTRLPKSAFIEPMSVKVSKLKLTKKEQSLADQTAPASKKEPEKTGKAPTAQDFGDM